MSYVLYKILSSRSRRPPVGGEHADFTPMSSSIPPSDLDTALRPAAETPTPAFSPLYQQIKSLILQSLESGEWRPGEAIPSEMDLAARFRVSQGTVRKAIDELAAENLVQRRQGKGTFVSTHAEQHVQYRFLRLFPDAGATDEASPAERQIVDFKRVRAGADVARALAVKTGEPAFQVRRVLSFGGVPTILEDLWLPAQTFKGLTLARMSGFQGATYAMFELEFGIRMVRAEEKLRAVLPDAEQAELLKTRVSVPMLSVERIAFTYNDVPMELRRGLYLTEGYHYRNTLN